MVLGGRSGKKGVTKNGVESRFRTKMKQSERKPYDGRTTERRIELILEISLESYATSRTDLLSLLLCLSFLFSSQV
jgi:hypothetical protein